MLEQILFHILGDQQLFKLPVNVRFSYASQEMLMRRLSNVTGGLHPKRLEINLWSTSKVNDFKPLFGEMFAGMSAISSPTATCNFS